MSEEEKPQEENKTLEAKKAEEQLKTTLRAVLDDDAYERMTNVSLANRDLYLAAAKNSLMLYKRLGRKITENELLSLLRAIKEHTEKSSNITFQRK
ncbi:hypothetical protein GF318_04430 [Candidatus Micrarchaeota archaeon]|nr:hypothetical protein [Candidatus Micrarchaeota archaeon]